MMRDDAEGKLARLRSDFKDGNEQLIQVEQQATALRETLLRISGAIQILEELLATESDATHGPQRDGVTLHVP